MNRRVLIPCVVVAVLSIVSSATATRLLITSKDIKNGTIRPVDLSPAAKTGMRGRQGPPGERGPAGFHTIFRSSELDVVTAHTDKVVTVSCSSGVAIGGGFSEFSTRPNVSVYESSPTDANGWQVRGYNFGSTYAYLSAYVLCAE